MTQPNAYQRPGLAYQHAFDWLAVQMQGIEDPYAGLVPSVFQGVELLRRLPEIPFMNPVPLGLVEASLALGLNHVAAVDKHEELAAVAWVEPRLKDVTSLTCIKEHLRPGGRLFLVVGGRLAHFLAERNGQNEAHWQGRKVRQALAENGFQVVGQLGFHGLRAVGWHYLGAAVALIGQTHWQDRCHYGMRRAFVELGHRQTLTALTCLVAERMS